MGEEPHVVVLAANTSWGVTRAPIADLAVPMSAAHRGKANQGQ